MGDECLYLGEYTARKGYQFSDTNNLVFNLKKPMDRRGQPGWHYKRRDIEQAGEKVQGMCGRIDSILVWWRRGAVGAVIQYVELNRVRAGLTQSAGDYVWSNAVTHLGGPDLAGVV